MIVVIAGVLPGLWPAISAARVDVLRVLGSQIGGSTAFLALAALLIQSFTYLADAPLGFARDRLVVAEFHPASNGYNGDASRRYVDALLDRVRVLPGVTGAAGLDRERPMLYFPITREQYEGALTVVVRTADTPTPVVRALANAARTVDPKVSMFAVKTMEQRMAVPLWPFRTMSWLFSICGGLALILGTVGLASVIIHAVNQRRREFGVRVAVGATPRDLIADVLSSASRLLVPGLLVGVLLAASLARRSLA